VLHMRTLLSLAILIVIGNVEYVFSQNGSSVNRNEGNRENRQEKDTEFAQKAVQKFLAMDDFRKIQSLITDWRALTTGQQKELIVLLLKNMESTQVLKLVNYQDVAVESRVRAKKMSWHMHGTLLKQDIFIVGGRCAWAIEELLGCTLPSITEDMKPEALHKAVQEAHFAIIRFMQLPTISKKHSPDDEK
jgi:hypothetical protein